MLVALLISRLNNFFSVDRWIRWLSPLWLHIEDLATCEFPDTRLDPLDAITGEIAAHIVNIGNRLHPEENILQVNVYRSLFPLYKRAW